MGNMKRSRIKEWWIFTLAGSVIGTATIALCFIALSLAEGGSTSPLEFGLMVMMSGVFSVFFAIIPSCITAAIMVQRTQTTKPKFILHSIATGFAVTAVCALAYCVVDGVSLFGSWGAIGSMEFWNQYTPHLAMASLTGICASAVGSACAGKRAYLA